MMQLSPTELQKLQLALHGEHDQLFSLLDRTQPYILNALLRNPSLSEEQILILLKRRDLPEDFIVNLYRRPHQEYGQRVLLAMVRNPACPSHLFRTSLSRLRLFELLDLCLLPGLSADHKLAAERALLQRMPTAPLGNKMTLARRGTANLVSALLKEGTPQVVELCLANPHLHEAAVFQFLRGAAAKADTISMVARHERWKQRPNLQLAILKNIRTPDIWYTLWLPKLPAAILQQLSASLKHHPGKARLLNQEKRRRGLD